MNANPNTTVADEAVEAILAYFTTVEAPINKADLISRNHTPYVSKVRATVWHYLKTAMGLSYVQIGKMFERDHTSVLSAVRTIHDKINPADLIDLSDYVNARVARALTERKAALLSEVAAS